MIGGGPLGAALGPMACGACMTHSADDLRAGGKPEWRSRPHTPTIRRPTCVVLIIGAGPAGLFAACELLRHGVKPRIVEQRLTPHHETRGTAIQPAVLELLHKAGVIEPFLAESVRIKEIELLGPGQARIGLTELAGLGCKYEFQCSQPQ
jgi:FAD binding domain